MSREIKIIAEIGFNHGGDIALAKNMIIAASKVGADIVKIQTYRAEDLVMRSSEHSNIIKDGELSLEQHTDLMSIAYDNGLQFLSTPFGLKSVEMLESLGVTAYKIASMDVTFIQLLKMVGETGKPVFLSTGMANIAEIYEALVVLEDSGCRDITLLHCLSKYPADPTDMKLSSMKRLKDIFRKPVGLSDHSLGVVVPIAAAALGASCIEKHFTSDNNLPSCYQGLSNCYQT